MKHKSVSQGEPWLRKMRGAARPITLEGLWAALIAFCASSVAVALLVCVVAAWGRPGAAWLFLFPMALVSGLLGVLFFPLVVPVLPFRHLVVGRGFPFLKPGYAFVALYLLSIAAIMSFGSLNSFLSLAGFFQVGGLLTALTFAWLQRHREPDHNAETLSSDSSGVRTAQREVLVIAVVLLVAVGAATIGWLSAKLFLDTDACLDAGGRMGGDSVCDYGPSGPN